MEKENIEQRSSVRDGKDARAPLLHGYSLSRGTLDAVFCRASSNVNASLLSKTGRTGEKPAGRVSARRVQQPRARTTET